MKLFLALILTLFASLSVQGSNWFVTPTGSGSHNGTTWNQSFAAGGITWASVQPGDTLWFAGGSYGQFGWNASGTAANRIYMKRARSVNPECTGTAGWNAAFDSQVVINVPGPSTNQFWISGVEIRNFYVTVDGQVPNGIRFKLGTPNVNWTTTTVPFYMGITLGGSHQLVQYVEVEGPGSSIPAGYGFQIGNLNRFGGIQTDVTVRYCNLHDCNTDLQIEDDTNLTLEFNDLGFCPSNFYNHGNAAYIQNCQYGVFRNNYVHNYPALGLFFTSSYAPGCNHWKVYGNLFVSGFGTGQGITFDANDYASPGPFQLGNDWYIANNTISGGNLAYRADSRWPQLFNSSVTGGTMLNNILWQTSVGTLGAFSHDYTFTDGSTTWGEPHGIVYGNNPFVNLAGSDYHIVSTVGGTYPRGKGAAIIPEVSPDKDGVARANPPSIGTYEYAGAGPAPPPSVPGALAWSSATYSASETGGDITLTVSRTVGTDGAVGATIVYVSGTAIENHDFTGATTSVSLGNGVSSASITVPILNSGDTSTNARTFAVALTNPTGGASLGPIASTTVSITMTPPPPPPPGLASFPTFTMNEGVITFPWYLTNSTQLYNPSTTDGAGLATYMLMITNAGIYWMTASVNAPDTGHNSWRPNFNQDPGLNDLMCWDITNLTTGFETRVVGWRGNGSPTYDQFPTNYWTLSAGTNTLYIRGRGEPGQLASFTLHQVTPPPPPPYAFLAWDTPGPLVYETADLFTFHLLRSGDTTNVTTVDYSTVAGTARAGINYVPASGTLTFGSGVASVPITLHVLYTPVYEGNTYYTVALTNASVNATILQTNLLVTVLEPPPPPTLKTNRLTNVRLFNVLFP